MCMLILADIMLGADIAVDMLFEISQSENMLYDFQKIGKKNH